MILEGLMAVIQPFTIVLVAVGVIVGIIFGSIPGLTATMAIVMFLPATYSMEASEGRRARPWAPAWCSPSRAPSSASRC